MRVAAALVLCVSLTGCLGPGSGARSPAAYPSPAPGGSIGWPGAAVGDVTLLPIVLLIAAVAGVDGAGIEPGSPGDEAGAARLRSAPIHARDPFVGWPPP